MIQAKVIGKVLGITRGFGKRRSGVGRALLGSLSLLWLCGQPSAAATLEMSSWLPASHPLIEKGLVPWTEAVAKATQGRVVIKLRAYQLGSARVHHDLVTNGVVDLAYGRYSDIRGQGFLRARVAEFGGLGKSAELISPAFWQAYSELLGAEKEHGDAKLLSAFVQSPGQLYLRSGQLSSAAGLKGLNIYTKEHYPQSLVQRWGAQVADLSMRPLAEQLARGVANAAIVSAARLYQTPVAEFISAVYTQRGGLSNQGWFLVINQSAWQRISPRDRSAIERLSGPALAKQLGQIWDALEASVLAQLRVNGVSIEPLPSTIEDDIWFFQKKLEANWYEAVALQGYNAHQALYRLRRLAKPKPKPPAPVANTVVQAPVAQ